MQGGFPRKARSDMQGGLRRMCRTLDEKMLGDVRAGAVTDLSFTDVSYWAKWLEPIEGLYGPRSRGAIRIPAPVHARLAAAAGLYSMTLSETLSLFIRRGTQRALSFPGDEEFQAAELAAVGLGAPDEKTSGIYRMLDAAAKGLTGEKMVSVHKAVHRRLKIATALFELPLGVAVEVFIRRGTGWAFSQRPTTEEIHAARRENGWPAPAVKGD